MTSTKAITPSRKRRPTPRKRCSDPNQLDFDALLGALDPNLDLLDVPAPPPAEPGGLDWSQRMRRLLKQALDACPLDHDQVAEGLSAVTGAHVTTTMLYSWTGASRPHRFPAEMIPAICAVTGNTLLLQGLADACGCRVSERQELQLARLGQLWLIMHHAQAEQTRMVGTLPLGEVCHG